MYRISKFHRCQALVASVLTMALAIISKVKCIGLMRWRHTLFKNRSALSSKKFFNLQRLLRIEMLQIPRSDVCCKHSSNSKGPYLIFFKLDVFVWIANCMSHYVEIAKIRKGYFPFFLDTGQKEHERRPFSPNSWIRLQIQWLPLVYLDFNLGYF